MRLLPLLTIALLDIQPAFAATHAIFPREAIQPKTAAADTDDIIDTFDGISPGDFAPNKAVRLVEVDGQAVTITGNGTWNGASNAPQFEGFTERAPGMGIDRSPNTCLP